MSEPLDARGTTGCKVSLREGSHIAKNILLEAEQRRIRTDELRQRIAILEAENAAKSDVLCSAVESAIDAARKAAE